MKRLLLFVLLLVCPIMGQEVRRPTVEADSTIGFLGCAGTRTASTAMPYSYDAGTPPTSTSSTMSTSSGGTGTQFFKARTFSSWASASGSYTSLTININGACAGTVGSNSFGYCNAQYTTDGGTTWNILEANNVYPNVSQASYSATITGTPLSSVQVRICASAVYDDINIVDTNTVFTVWDIWTSGTLAGGSTSKGLMRREHRRR